MFIQIISFLVVFIVIVYSISLLAKGVTKILSQASLGLFNKFLGSIFGTLKWAIISSVILFFATKINQWITIIDQEMINKSFLYPTTTSFFKVFISRHTPGHNTSILYYIVKI